MDIYENTSILLLVRRVLLLVDQSCCINFVLSYGGVISQPICFFLICKRENHRYMLTMSSIMCHM